MNDTLGALSAAGVSIWLDDLSRERLVSGSLADLAAHDHVVGVTTNPASSPRPSPAATLTTRSCGTWLREASTPGKRSGR